MPTSNHPAPHPPLLYRGHIAGLDVLRGLAVLGVLLYHAYWNTLDQTHWHGAAAVFVALTGFGYTGVHLFFVLSGFLITGILLDGENTPRAARHFYARRARRILPAYLAILAALWLTHLVDARFLLACMLFIINMGRLVGAHLSEYTPLWSLAVEEQFYLVWPWVLWRLQPRTIWRLMLLGLFVPPLLRLVLSARGQDPYFKTYVNVDYLMYGSVVAWTLRSGALHQGNVRRIARWLLFGAGAGLAVSALVAVLAPGQLWVGALFNSVGRLPEMALFVAMLLSCVIAHQSAPGLPAARLRQLPRQALVFLGYISYGLYLVHMLVFDLYDRYVTRTALGAYQHSFALLNLRAICCCGVSILIAWLSRSTLEQWFLRRRSSSAPPVHPSTPPA